MNGRMMGWRMLMLLGLWFLAGACVRDSVEISPASGTSIGSNVPAGPIYTGYNLWYEKPDSIYSTGYHVGTMMPAGTQVADVRIERKYITFKRLSDRAPFRIEFVERHHPGLTIRQFCARLFVSKSLGELTEGFTAEERQAVRAGELQVGLRKQAVLVAYGYPVETYTKSLQDNTWIFMRNRFARKAIGFDANGLTTREASVDPNAL